MGVPFNIIAIVCMLAFVPAVTFAQTAEEILAGWDRKEKLIQLEKDMGSCQSNYLIDAGLLSLEEGKPLEYSAPASVAYLLAVATNLESMRESFPKLGWDKEKFDQRFGRYTEVSYAEFQKYREESRLSRLPDALNQLINSERFKSQEFQVKIKNQISMACALDTNQISLEGVALAVFFSLHEGKLCGPRTIVTSGGWINDFGPETFKTYETLLPQIEAGIVSLKLRDGGKDFCSLVNSYAELSRLAELKEASQVNSSRNALPPKSPGPTTTSPAASVQGQ